MLKFCRLSDPLFAWSSSFIPVEIAFDSFENRSLRIKCAKARRAKDAAVQKWDFALSAGSALGLWLVFPGIQRGNCWYHGRATCNMHWMRHSGTCSIEQNGGMLPGLLDRISRLWIQPSIPCKTEGRTCTGEWNARAVGQREGCARSSS